MWTHPRLPRTVGRWQRLVLGVWSAAALLASPSFYFYGPSGGGGGGDDRGGSLCEPFATSAGGAAIVYVVMTTSLTFVLPAALVSAVYTKVGKYIWRLGINGRTFQRTTNPVQRAKVRYRL